MLAVISSQQVLLPHLINLLQ